MAQPNGTNGHTNGTNPSDPIPATHLLASFAANAQTTHLTAALRTKVKEVLLDFIGVTVGALTHASSTLPILTAITALQGPTVTATSPGVCTVLAQGEPRFLKQYAGLLNAALGHSLDFDDTYAPGTLHAGVTAISAALAEAESLANEGRTPSADEVMLAISVAYEATCRLGRELGYEAYSRGFHNTSTAGIFGSIAALAVLRHLDTRTVEMAFGLAGSKAAGSMQYLDNGSWNKRLHPGFAVHDAFMCVALAEAGVVGASRILEGTSGFFKAYTPSESVDLGRLVEGLGKKWEWLGSSLKPYPACRMTHAFIELSGNMQAARAKSSRVSPDEIKSVELRMSPANYILVGDPTPNKRHPTNVIDAQFSAYFQVAHSLLYEAKTGDMSPYSRLEDPAIHQLTDKISVKTDKSMSGFGAKMSVQWTDGQPDSKEQQFPLGETEHPFTRDKVEEKFMALAVPVYGETKSSQIVQAVDSLEEMSILQLLKLLR
ncbi:hypothetical protein LTR91_005124 [Friedmanniomyces endolithicus]|uniref:MmgE/PrpD family protein n=1 Tax=Friedmanniomyces endolithicus TaxID=329885 RepID=A0AAN6KUF8_9PEZI|nr:hypothetical protein LTR94_003768 [Friedmanniomyces endolithicus]KAK0768196.1 hypothetical protein LTR59_017845 [Friedmanniomyces endolithicus]KAK0769779.1 hypothetical protein LTR38_017776 [Friedmanniomyces endolithicus]KAK0820687.1 hypothetical protein LTR75_001565 [Friedmanniomyces endolithicus]KAK0824490.1 hypothetical protein LTR03_017727 [Friedmanniomyces endolithicus]